MIINAPLDTSQRYITIVLKLGNEHTAISINYRKITHYKSGSFSKKIYYTT